MRPARPRSAATPARLTAPRRTAFVAGALYLVTFLTSVPTLALYRPVLDARRLRAWLGQHHQRPGRDIARGAPRRFLCRHGRGPVPGGAEAERDGGPRIPRRPADRRRPHPRRGHQPVVNHHPAPGRRGRRRRPRWSPPAQALVAVYNQAFLLSQSLMPAFSALCLGSVCTAPAWYRVPSRCWACRRPPAAGLRCSDPLGRLRPAVPARGPGGTPGRLVGVGLGPGSSFAGSSRLHPRRIRRPSTTLSQEREPDPCQRDVDAD